MGGLKLNQRSDPRETRRTGPLRSGRSYQRDRVNTGPNQVPVEPTHDSGVPQGTGLVNKQKDLETLDLPWTDFRREQEKDPTLKKVFELLKDPDPRLM